MRKRRIRAFRAPSTQPEPAIEDLFRDPWLREATDKGIEHSAGHSYTQSIIPQSNWRRHQNRLALRWVIGTRSHHAGALNAVLNGRARDDASQRQGHDKDALASQHAAQAIKSKKKLEIPFFFVQRPAENAYAQLYH